MSDLSWIMADVPDSVIGSASEFIKGGFSKVGTLPKNSASFPTFTGCSLHSGDDVVYV